MKNKLLLIISISVLCSFAQAHQHDSIFTFKTISLNGDWLFTKNVENIPDGISKPDFKWETISVPSEWYMESFQVEPGKWGGYYKEFELPVDWQNQKTLIRFGAVESECRIYLNGKYVGEHTGSMTQFEKDLTHFLRSGKNQLVIYVRSESLASGISKKRQKL